MVSPPEQRVRIQDHFTELFLIVPFIKIVQIVGSASSDKGAIRALDEKCLKMSSPPEPLVEIQNYFTGSFLMVPSGRQFTCNDKL